MYTLMYLQVTSIAECFIAHIAAIWTLPTMYMLMYLQNSYMPESFITHITGIWTLPYVHVDVASCDPVS